MTPEERARVIFGKYLVFLGDDSQAKRCSVLCVLEIIEQLPKGSSIWLYWIKVKQAIEKI